MQAELIDKIERLYAIKPLWDNLLARFPARDFFLLPHWFFAWWDVFKKGKSLFFVALWKKKELYGLFPLYKTNKGPFGIISFTGHPRLADRMDFIISPGHEKECLSLFSSWIFSRHDWDLLSLRQFAPFSNNSELLNQILEKSGKRCNLSIDDHCHFISTDKYQGFDAYLKSAISKSRRSSLRKMGNRLNRCEEVEWNVLNSVDDSMVDEMAELDSKRSARGLKGLSFFHSPLNKVFLKRLSKQIINHENVLLFTLRIHGSLSSYALIFKYNNKLLGYQTSFDMNLSRLSVGTQTFFQCIKYAFENNYEELDFLRGEHAYKNIYTQTYRQNKCLFVYKGNLKSYILYLYHIRIKPLLKRLKNYALVEKLVPANFRSKLDI